MRCLSLFVLLSLQGWNVVSQLQTKSVLFYECPTNNANDTIHIQNVFDTINAVKLFDLHLSQTKVAPFAEDGYNSVCVGGSSDSGTQLSRIHRFLEADVVVTHYMRENENVMETVLLYLVLCGLGMQPSTDPRSFMSFQVQDYLQQHLLFPRWMMPIDVLRLRMLYQSALG